MKAKRIMPLLLSAIMTVGTATAVSFTASAVETNAPVVSAQSAKTSLATPKISKAESVNGGVKLTWSKVKGAEKYRFTTRAVRAGQGLQTQPQRHTQTVRLRQARHTPTP